MRREEAIAIAERDGKKWKDLTDAERATYHTKVPDYVRNKEASRAFYYNIYLRNLLVASGLSPKEASTRLDGLKPPGMNDMEWRNFKNDNLIKRRAADIMDWGNL